MYNIKTLPPKQKGNIHKKLINILSSVGDYSLREKLLVTFCSYCLRHGLNNLINNITLLLRLSRRNFSIFSLHIRPNQTVHPLKWTACN